MVEMSPNALKAALAATRGIEHNVVAGREQGIVPLGPDESPDQFAPSPTPSQTIETYAKSLKGLIDAGDGKMALGLINQIPELLKSGTLPDRKDPSKKVPIREYIDHYYNNPPGFKPTTMDKEEFQKGVDYLIRHYVPQRDAMNKSGNFIG